MNNIIKEEMNWTNSNEGVMTIESELPIKRGDQVIGKKTDVTTITATYTEVVDGLNVAKDRIIKTRQKINQKELEFAQLGSNTELSPELEDLRNKVLEIDRIMKCKNLKNELDSLKEELQKDENWKELREKVLNNRPKEVKTEQKE